MSCSVKGCSSHSGRKGKELLTFHRFPKDELKKRRWISSIVTRPNWKWYTRSLICSKHFTPLSFVEDRKWRRLHDDAIPTLHLSPNTLATVPPRNSDSTITTTQRDTSVDTDDHRQEILSTTQLWITDDTVDVKEEIVTTTQRDITDDTNDDIAEIETTTQRETIHYTDDFEEGTLTTTQRDAVYDTVDVKAEILNTTQRETLYYTVDFEEEILPSIQRETVWCTDDVKEEIPMLTRETATQTHFDIDELKPPSVDRECNTAGSQCEIALKLQQELDRVKKVSERRLKKINSLSKAVCRLKKRSDFIYDNLMHRLKTNK